MTQRWWAPQRATVEPDQVVLALLEPGGDAAGDLGSALLAVHRAGAAACEAVAKGAVPSEMGLLDALARCRAAVAGPAVDTVSKALEPTYAGLLLRDVFDDAETSALSLYRTCVSKGVAPPLAAQRAGAVFGVPAKELGKYTSLAADPRVNPAVLTDAADRALLGYVSKLVEQESAGIKETVSKSPTGHARELGDSSEGWEEREHPRDATTGRFVHASPHAGPPVREGRDSSIQIPGIQLPEPVKEQSPLERLRQRLGIGGAPKVADQPAAPPVARKPRQQRTQRQQRQPRAQRSAPQAHAQQSATMSASLHASPALQAKLAQVLASPQAHLKAANADSQAVPKDTPGPVRRSKDFSGTALEVKEEPNQYGMMHTPNGEWLTFHLTLPEGMATRRSMVPVEGNLIGDPPLLLRAHALIDAIPYDGPQMMDPDDPSGRGERSSRYTHQSAASLREAASAAKAELGDTASIGVVDPLVSRVGPDDVLTSGSLDDELRRRRELLATDVSTNADGQVVPRLEDEAYRHSLVAQDYYDDSAHWAVVPTRDQYGDYNLPMVHEYVVADEVRGGVEGGFRSPQVHIDRNQAFVVGSEPLKLYDPVNKVIVLRYVLKPVDEDEVELLTTENTGKIFPGRFGKAMGGDRYDRDSRGRFSEVETRTSQIAPIRLPGVELPEPVKEKPAVAPRQPRQPRQQRQMRIARPSAVTRSATPVARMSASLSARPEPAKLRSALRSALHASSPVATMPEEQRKEMPVLDDRRRYRLMTGAEFAEILSKLPEPDKSGVIPIYGPALHLLRKKTELDGSEAVVSMSDNVDAEIRSREGEPTKGYVWQRKPAGKGPLRTEADEIAMGEHIRQIFDSFPDVAQLHIDYAENGGGYVLYANRFPIQEQALVEVDDDLDLSNPVELIDLGKYRSTEMLIRHGDTGVLTDVLSALPDSPTPINAVMHQFRLQNAPVRRYRMQNRS